MGGPLGFTETERFLAKIDRSSECWQWTRSTRGKGYGQFRTSDFNTVLAHRYAWELWRGPVPAGMFVCHHCDNPGCVNPDHLFLGTNTDNMRDCRDKGRLRVPRLRGEKHGSAKLTASQVEAIRADGRPRATLAQIYRVHCNTIANIQRQLTWR